MTPLGLGGLGCGWWLEIMEARLYGLGLVRGCGLQVLLIDRQCVRKLFLVLVLQRHLFQVCLHLQVCC